MQVQRPSSIVQYGEETMPIPIGEEEECDVAKRHHYLSWLVLLRSQTVLATASATVRRYRDFSVAGSQRCAAWRWLGVTRLALPATLAGGLKPVVRTSEDRVSIVRIICRHSHTR